MTQPHVGKSYKHLVSFRYALPDVVATSLLALAQAERREGLDPWVTQTFAALSPGMQDDLLDFFAPFGVPLILSQVAEQSPTLDNFTAFIGWVSSISDQAVEEGVASALQWASRYVSGEPLLEVNLSLDKDEHALALLENERTYRGSDHTISNERAQQLLRLLRDPSEFKARLVYVLIQFWENHFKTDYAACARTIAQNIEYHHERVFEQNFLQFYHRVTSQHLLEKDRNFYPQIQRITFIPSCYSGANVTAVALDREGQGLAIVYNCRVPGRAGNARIPIQELYGPLKALADETRLEILSLLDGNERYGQEIVELLDVGQSTVSRHLGLLVGSGVVQERRVSGMKFYRINEHVLNDLARLLSTYRSASDQSK